LLVVLPNDIKEIPLKRLFAIIVLFVGGAIVLNQLARKIGAGRWPFHRSEQSQPKEQEFIARGKELFTREWLPGDSRSHAGDGLGPLFNARSCADCHQLGGLGGAGGRQSNVTVASVFLVGDASQKPAKSPQQPNRAKLAEIHPALRSANSFPLHRFGNDKEYDEWRTQLLSGATAGFAGLMGRGGLGSAGGGGWGSLDLSSFGGLSSLGQFTISHKQVDQSSIDLVFSERNAPALFGSGLIDRIPAQVFHQVAARQAWGAEEEPEDIDSESEDKSFPVRGRVSLLKDGRIGRFGWKGEVATLHDFTLRACAVELGLEVPGFSKTGAPWKPGYKAPGLDLNEDQCNALVKFVATLPHPTRKPPETEQHAAETATGQKLFERIGCAVCHQPKLGNVEGIYSDLLLHDMGDFLADNGEYGTSIMASDETKDNLQLPLVVEGDGKEPAKPKFSASSREWRTPPLWGLRDSPPYLHDGRADTIAAAIVAHQGEGLASAQKFKRLSLHQQHQLELFLQSLVAPGSEH
jgi:CxxC motif-containing protein (DUF1111 family)